MPPGAARPSTSTHRMGRNWSIVVSPAYALVCPSAPTWTYPPCWPRTVQVMPVRTPEAAQLDALRQGVTLNDGPTRPAQVRAIEAPALWPRDPPVRFRKSVPDAWLELSIGEGRNRQVRRMTAAVGLPTLRLVRVAIGAHALGDLAPGMWRALA